MKSLFLQLCQITKILSEKAIMASSLAVLFFQIFISDSWSAARATTFDEREICEKNQGVWRQFGNGCANHCESAFDQYSICTNSLVFACDCGKNRCWNEGKCVDKSEFKKVFDKKKAEEDKKLQEARKERQEKYKALQQEILAKLSPTAADPSVQNQDGQNFQGQNPQGQNFQGQNFQNSNQQNLNAPNQAIIAQPAPILANSPDNNSSNLANQNSSQDQNQTKKSEQEALNKENVPPLFLKKQQQATTTENSESTTQSSTNNSSSATGSDSKKSDLLPGLPVIPLPK